MPKTDRFSETEGAEFVTREIRNFARTSPANLMPFVRDYIIFNEPLVGFADGDDPLFEEYKKIIASTYLTPREALAKALEKDPAKLPGRLSVISWVMPIAEPTRISNRHEGEKPTRLWSHTRWYGEKFNDALRAHLTHTLASIGYLAAAPALQTYFKVDRSEKGPFSNWSERHVAYTAGLGTFGLSDGFISEKGIAHRCGSVVTDMALPSTRRTAENPYANCLFFAEGNCGACIKRCPANAISEKGHDKVRCENYQRDNIGYLLKEYEVGVAGCGLCQTGVPCEFMNPRRR